MINISLTQDFRLTADDRNFIVKERRMVDPTLAPNWKARVAKDPTLDPTPREVWEDAGWYSYTPAGLVAALESVRIKAAARGNAETLEEFVAELAAQSKRIADALEAGGLRPFDVRLLT
ncbi:hypothetical protein P4H42_03860 [Paenibacillus macerans]|uniref:hypothetical protein n=1 Tax=Paenibacillus macerans TaxID=44252 RepID=UPI002DBB5049|nr:hypothetical protein [Paenibacillus macerans]MEC0328759.1 hypothetical protein [Paenibacillus macerans]